VTHFDEIVEIGGVLVVRRGQPGDAESDHVESGYAP
jgi:hypothetical protein